MSHTEWETQREEYDILVRVCAYVYVQINSISRGEINRPCYYILCMFVPVCVLDACVYVRGDSYVYVCVNVCLCTNVYINAL